MEQNMTEQELELLKQIREDLDVVEHEYGCKIDREQLLTKVLERNLNPVRPEEAALFFSGVLPAGWQQSYLGKKKLSWYLNKLRDEISVWWYEEYLEPELSALHRSDSIKAYFKDHEIPASDNHFGSLKYILSLQCKKKELFAFRERIDEYLKELKVQANISPHFRFIPPERFAEIVNIYMDAIEERGECTQEKLGDLLGQKQGTVSKLRNAKNNISTEKEYRVLICLYYLHLMDDLQKDIKPMDIRLMSRRCFCIYPNWIKQNRLFSAFYLGVLLGFSLEYNWNRHLSTPATIADLNHLLKKNDFTVKFDPDAEGTFSATSPKEFELNIIPLRQLIRLPDRSAYFPEVKRILDEIMEMDEAYLQLLYQMPEVFLTDLVPYTMLDLVHFIEDMRQLHQPGRNYLKLKMETVAAGWSILSLERRVSHQLFLYLKEFFQLMEYLSDNTPSFRQLSQASCTLAVSNQKYSEPIKPLTDTQRQDYRVLFEDYVNKNFIFGLKKTLLQFKFNMTMPEWYFWMKMELLWYTEKDYLRWHRLMEKCMQEAREADREASGDAP